MTNREIYELFSEHYDKQKELYYAETKRNLLDLLCAKYLSLQNKQGSLYDAVSAEKDKLFKAFHNLFTELAAYAGKEGLSGENWKKACEFIDWFGVLMKDENKEG